MNLWFELFKTEIDRFLQKRGALLGTMNCCVLKWICQQAPPEFPVSIFNSLILTMHTVYHEFPSSAAHAFSENFLFSLKYSTLILFQIASCIRQRACIEYSAVGKVIQ